MADNGSGTSRRSRGRNRLPCDVAVDPLQRVGGGKRERARKHLVQGDAQRVEIAASINRAIHAAGLFGRHVGEGAGNDLGRRGRLAFVWQSRRNAKASEPYVAGVVDEHVRGLDVFMYQTALMDLAECRSPGQWRCAGRAPDRAGCSLSRSRTRSRGSPPGSVSTRIVRPS